MHQERWPKPSAIGGGPGADRWDCFCPWVSLEIAFAKFVGEVVAGTPAQRHDGPGGILATGIDESAAVHDEQVFDVVRLLVLIEDRGFRIVAHARGAHFVDGPTLGQDAVAGMDDFKSGGLKHFLGGVPHVLGHLVFVVAEFVMEAQRGNAPFVLHDGIEVHIIFIAGQDFAKRSHTDLRALVLANLFLEGRAETVDVGAAGKHRTSAAALKAVATDEVGAFLSEIAKTRNVKSAGAAVVERWWFADEILGAACDSGAHDVFAEIVAYVPAGVRYSVRIEARFGKQEKASGLQRRGGNDHYLGLGVVIFFGLGIDEMYAGGFAGLRIDGDFAHYGVGPE